MLKIKTSSLLAFKEDWYTLFCMGAFALCLAIPFFIDVPLYYVPALWIITFHFSFCVNLINHNHAHVPTFKNKKLNFFMDIALTLLRGASAVFIKIIHNINHHRYEGSEEDWFAPSNEGKGNALKRSLNYIFVTAKRFKVGATQYFEKMDKNFKQTQKIERIALVLFILLLALINIKAFFFFVLPAWIFGNFFLVYTNLIFHKNSNPQNKFTNSYNFLNRLENRLYFNGGYHSIHHLHPNLHWSELPAAHQREIEPNISSSYVKGSMFAHMFKSTLRN